MLAEQVQEELKIGEFSMSPFREAWITGLAFLSANLGAQEVIGMGASGHCSGGSHSRDAGPANGDAIACHPPADQCGAAREGVGRARPQPHSEQPRGYGNVGAGGCGGDSGEWPEVDREPAGHMAALRVVPPTHYVGAVEAMDEISAAVHQLLQAGAPAACTRETAASPARRASR